MRFGRELNAWLGWPNSRLSLLWMHSLQANGWSVIFLALVRQYPDDSDRTVLMQRFEEGLGSNSALAELESSEDPARAALSP